MQKRGKIPKVFLWLFSFDVHVWGRSSGGSIKPPKVKQTQIFLPCFFLVKKGLVSNNNN